ncbi:uncharacterized protein OCT59_020535 [Rhizophagus irregularis]|uniref:uncharacterized protein n=1 Tax=Rhizophagus irregularis TaxID=588596 RepID=UPI003323CF78|nr:hypothetical protein OCT59_020535 [Rhizophagus irregularis]
MAELILLATFCCDLALVCIVVVSINSLTIGLGVVICCGIEVCFGGVGVGVEVEAVGVRGVRCDKKNFDENE